jgi:uncharacterized membrane protein YedE/YeeE
VRGAVEDALSTPDAPRLRGYLLAAVLALAGTQALAAGGLIDLGKTFYLPNPLQAGGAILGGLLFGFGMVLAGGCGARLLVLAAGGNLRSLVTLLVMGLAAYATLRGVLAPMRTALGGATAIDLKTLGLADQGLVSLISGALGLSTGVARGLLVAALALPALAFIARRRVAARHLVGGALIGLLVPAAFLATGVVGADEFEPIALEGVTVTGPWANAVVYALTYTGASLDFGIAWVLGIPVGAAAVALLRGEARLEGFDGATATGRYILGGLMMGVGGVLATGCTIGQGLTGVSTLSLGSFLAFGALVTGGAWALRRRQRATPSVRPVAVPAE